MWEILIVDDEPILVDGLYFFLKRQHDELFSLTRAYSGEEAMRLVTQNKYDLIISDIFMPGIDGLNLLKVIKRLWPQTRVILLSAHKDFDYVYYGTQYDGVRPLLKSTGFGGILETVLLELKIYEQQQKEAQQLALLKKRASTIIPLFQQTILRDILLGHFRFSEENMEKLILARLDISPQLPVLPILGWVGCEDSDVSQGGLVLLAEDIHILLCTLLEHLPLNINVHWQERCIVWLIQPREELENNALMEAYNVIYNMLPVFQNSLENNHLPLLSLIIQPHWLSFEALSKAYEHMIDLSSMPQHQDVGVILIAQERSVIDSGSAMLTMDSPQAQKLLFLLQAGKWKNFLRGAERLLQESAGCRRQLRHNTLMLSAIMFSEMGKLPDFDVESYSDAMKLVCDDVTAVDIAAFLQFAQKTLSDIHAMKEKEKATSQDHVIGLVDGYIQTHYQEDLSLIGIAEFIGYNPSYLSRLYKQRTGENLSRQISRIRISKAKRMLHESDMSIQAIARAVGIESPKYFTVLFKNETGMTPQAYRGRDK